MRTIAEGSNSQATNGNKSSRNYGSKNNARLMMDLLPVDVISGEDSNRDATGDESLQVSPATIIGGAGSLTGKAASQLDNKKPVNKQTSEH